MRRQAALGSLQLVLPALEGWPRCDAGGRGAAGAPAPRVPPCMTQCVHANMPAPTLIRPPPSPARPRAKGAQRCGRIRGAAFGRRPRRLEARRRCGGRQAEGPCARGHRRALGEARARHHAHFGKKPRADPHTFVPSMSLRVDEYKFVKPPQRRSNVEHAAPLVRMPAFEQQPASKARWNSSPR